MTAATTVAVISAVIALLSAVGVELIRRRASLQLARFTKESDAELVRLRNDLAAEAEARTRNAQLAELVRAYQNPVLRSAYDLQSRIYNIHQNAFRGPAGEDDYFASNTLYLIAEFFGWLEIVRREMQFLELDGDERTRRLKDALDQVQDRFASTSRVRSDPLYVYRGQQRAIGELMIVELTDPLHSGLRSTCMGFATFDRQRSVSPLSDWLARIEARLVDLTGPELARLVEIQHALIDLVDLLDPNRVRFTTDREKIPTAF